MTCELDETPGFLGCRGGRSGPRRRTPRGPRAPRAGSLPGRRRHRLDIRPARNRSPVIDLVRPSHRAAGTDLPARPETLRCLGSSRRRPAPLRRVRRRQSAGRAAGVLTHAARTARGREVAAPAATSASRATEEAITSRAPPSTIDEPPPRRSVEGSARLEGHCGRAATTPGCAQPERVRAGARGEQKTALPGPCGGPAPCGTEANDRLSRPARSRGPCVSTVPVGLVRPLLVDADVLGLLVGAAR